MAIDEVKQIEIRIVSLARKHPHAKGVEVNFRIESLSDGDSIDLSSSNIREILDGEGGNGKFFQLPPGEEVTFNILANAVIAFLCHPWSGQAEVYVDGEQIKTIDLFARKFWVKRINANQPFYPLGESSGRFIQDTNSLFQSKKLVAVCCPRWKGVASSTSSLFENVFFLPAEPSRTPQSLDAAEILYAGEMIAQRQPEVIVFSGGDLVYLELATMLRNLLPDVRIFLLWHSNFIQCGEYHDYSTLLLWISEVRNHRIDGIGVVKKGFDDFLKSMGVPSFHLENIVTANRVYQNRPSLHDAATDDPRVGIWLSSSSNYRKPPQAMLAAMRLLQDRGIKLSGSGLGGRGMAVAQSLGLNWEFLSEHEIDRNLLHKMMARMSVNLYVTISECSPMLPLESWALGVPCLIGPSCKLYDEDELLCNTLIVYNSADPHEIFEKCLKVIENRVQILGRLDRLMETLRERAESTLAQHFD